MLLGSFVSGNETSQYLILCVFIVAVFCWLSRRGEAEHRRGDQSLAGADVRTVCQQNLAVGLHRLQRRSLWVSNADHCTARIVAYMQWYHHRHGRVAGEGRRVVAPPCPRSTARLQSSPVGRVESFRSWSSHLFRGRPGGRRHVRSGGRLSDTLMWS